MNRNWGPRGPHGVIDNEIRITKGSRPRVPTHQRTQKGQAKTRVRCVTRINYGYKCYHSVGRTVMRHATYYDWQECADEGPEYLPIALKYAKQGLEYLKMPQAYIEEYVYQVMLVFGTPEQQQSSRQDAVRKPWWSDHHNNRRPLLGVDSVREGNTRVFTIMGNTVTEFNDQPTDDHGNPLPPPRTGTWAAGSRKRRPEGVFDPKSKNPTKRPPKRQKITATPHEHNDYKTEDEPPTLQPSNTGSSTAAENSRSEQPLEEYNEPVGPELPSIADDALSSIERQAQPKTRNPWNPSGFYGAVDNEIGIGEETTMPCVRRIRFGYKCYIDPKIRHATYFDWSQCSHEGPLILEAALHHAKEGLRFLKMAPSYLEEYEYRVLTTFGTLEQRAAAHQQALGRRWFQISRTPLLGTDTVAPGNTRVFTIWGNTISEFKQQRVDAEGNLITPSD